MEQILKIIDIWINADETIFNSFSAKSSESEYYRGKVKALKMVRELLSLPHNPLNLTAKFLRFCDVERRMTMSGHLRPLGEDVRRKLTVRRLSLGLLF